MKPFLESFRSFRPALLSVLLQGIQYVGGFLASLLLARILLPASFGEYSLYLSVGIVLWVPFHLAMPILVVRELASSKTESPWTLVGFSLVSSTAYFVLVIVAAFVANTFRAIDFSIANFSVVTLSMYLISVFRTLEAVHQSSLRYIRGQLSEKLVFPTALVLSTLMLIGVAGKLDVYHALLAHSFSAFVGLLVQITIFQRRRYHLGADKNTQILGRLTRSFLSLTIVSSLSVLMAQTDILMLGMLGSVSEAGFYRVSITLAATALLAVTPLSVLLAPRLAKQFASNNLSALAPTLVRAARLAFALSMPLLLPFILFGDRLIIYLYGPEFVDSFAPLAILSVGYIFNVGTGFVHLTLNMTGLERKTIVGVSSALILNVILNAVLIPQYGAVGAAIATTTATIMANSLLWLFVWKSHGIDVSLFGVRRRISEFG